MLRWFVIFNLLNVALTAVGLAFIWPWWVAADVLPAQLAGVGIVLVAITVSSFCVGMVGVNRP